MARLEHTLYFTHNLKGNFSAEAIRGRKTNTVLPLTKPDISFFVLTQKRERGKKGINTAAIDCLFMSNVKQDS